MAKAKRARKTKSSTHTDSTLVRLDAMVNALTGIGGNNDRRRRTRPTDPVWLGESDLTALYRGGGIPRRVVDLLANDACRNWFTISNDEDNKAKQRLEELKAQERVTHGIKMGRCYGGALVVMVVDDGQDLDEPVDEDRIRAVRGLTVFDKREIHVGRQDIEDDISSPHFGEPMMYRIYPLTGGDQFQVHASRVMRFDGDKLGWREFQSRGYWHDSVLQTAWEPIRQLAAVMDSSEFILEQYVINTFKVPGLLGILGKKDGDNVLQKRLRMLDQSMHVANHAMLDEAEEYMKHSSSVAGTDRLLAHFELGLSAATGYPVTLFFGRSPAGMNATGEADINFYYDRVRSWQASDLKPQLEPLVRYVFKSEGFGEPDSWSIIFNPLRQMSEREISDLYKANAEADAIYIAHQALDPRALAKHRFVGDEYNSAPPSITQEEFDAEEREREEEVALELERFRQQAQQQQQNQNANGNQNQNGEPPPQNQAAD